MMRKIYYFCTLFMLFSSNLSAASTPSGSGVQEKPSPDQNEILLLPESTNACVGNNEGDTCTYIEKNKKNIGTCKKNKEGKMACSVEKLTPN